jgi:hypothetical protein
VVNGIVTSAHFIVEEEDKKWGGEKERVQKLLQPYFLKNLCPRMPLRGGTSICPFLGHFVLLSAAPAVDLLLNAEPY